MHIVKKYLLSLTFMLILSVNLYAQLTKNEKALLIKYKNNAEKYEKNNKYELSASEYYKAGYLYLDKNDGKEAAKYFKKSSALYLKIKKYKKVQKIYSNLGLIYANLGEYRRAYKYFDKSLKIRKHLGNKSYISAGMIDLAYILGLQRKEKKAILTLIEALDIASEINNSKLILICYKMLAEYYEKLGNNSKSSEYRNKFSEQRKHYRQESESKKKDEDRIKTIVDKAKRDAEERANDLKMELLKKQRKEKEDSLNRELAARADSLKIKNAKQAAIDAKFELIKKRDELLKAESEKKSLYIQSQRLVTTSIIAAFLLFLLIFGVIVYTARKRKRHNKELHKTNIEIEKQKNIVDKKNEELSFAFKKIEEQNFDIASSINYARDIQKAILPNQSKLSDYLESFIFFEPRDKVSGDFFWFKETQYMNGSGMPHKKLLISAIDCTGHGVPGALLSMVSYNIIDGIVSSKKIHTPSVILDNLHKGIRETFKQAETKNTEGMDMALCAYDYDKGIIEFSGAKNPVIYIKNKEINIIKGDVKPIGGAFLEKTENSKFTNKTIELDTPTCFYIFSDGFPDQIGGKHNRKFMIKRFRELLLQIHEKPMTEQKKIIDSVLKKWKGKEPQVDDILVIGFKIDINKDKKVI